MRKIMIIAGLLFATACAEGGYVHTRNFFLKNGVSYDRYERDTVSCVNLATVAAPNAPQVGWIPYVGVYSVDQNTGLRQANLEICMRDNGYAYVPVPLCPRERRADTIANGFGRKSDLSQRLSVRADSCFVGHQGQFLFSR